MADKELAKACPLWRGEVVLQPTRLPRQNLTGSDKRGALVLEK